MLQLVRKNRVLDLGSNLIRIQNYDNNAAAKLLVEAGFLHFAHYEAFLTPTRASYH